MSPTAPWAADTPTLMAAGALTHTATATVTTPDGDIVDIPILDGTLSYDDTRSPRVELSLTTHLIPDVALTARIDPRKPTRVALSVGYTRPDGIVDVQAVCDLGLRSRTRTRPDDELRLVARSDEALIIDDAPTASITVTAADTRTAIGNVIKITLPSVTIVTTATTAGPAVNFTENDVDKWTCITDFADRIGAVVYDGGMRTWYVADRPNATGTPNHSVSDGPQGTMLDIEESVDRDAGFANRVLLVNEWTNTAGTPQRIVAGANATGTYAPATGNYCQLRIDRDTPTTQTDANNAATKLVARTVTRGRVLTITAVSAYWLRPGDTLTVTEADRPAEDHLVAAVTFDLRTGLMQITTRVPE